MRPDLRIFPVIFPVIREFTWRPVRSGLRRQPATGVSSQGFPALGEVSTFREVSVQEPDLCRQISDTQHRRPRFPGVSLCPMNFEYPKTGRGACRDRLRFRGDQFESAIRVSIDARRIDHFQQIATSRLSRAPPRSRAARPLCSATMSGRVRSATLTQKSHCL
jgi:hypothetical protein